MYLKFDKCAFALIVDDELKREIEKISKLTNDELKAFEDDLKALNIGTPQLVTNGTTVFLKGFEPILVTQNHPDFKRVDGLRIPKRSSKTFKENKALLTAEFDNFDIRIRRQIDMPIKIEKYIVEARGIFILSADVSRMGNDWIYRYFRDEENIEIVSKDKRFKNLENYEMQKMYDEYIKEKNISGKDV